MTRRTKAVTHKKPRDNKEIIGAICGDCEGLSRRALLRETDTSPAKLCKDSKLGHKENSLSCKSFSPDLFALDKNARVALRQLSSLIKKFDPKALRVVAAMLANEHRTRQNELRFGQIMYVRYRGYAGSDYVSNFLKAFVLDARDGYVRLMSSDGEMSLTFEIPSSGAFTGPVLYDAQSFRPLLRKMRQQKKFNDPKGEQTSKRLHAVEDPSFKKRKEGDFDAAIISLDGALRSKPKRKKGRGVDADFVDLRDMVDQIETGRVMGRIGDGEDDGAEALELSSNLYRRKSVGGPKKPRRSRGTTSIEI